MPERESISSFLKEYRRMNGESQFEFAENIGICVEELSKLERKIANPNLETLQKIAAYTGKTVSELVAVGRSKECMEICRMLMTKYIHSERYQKLFENKFYIEMRRNLETGLGLETYLEQEEILNEWIYLMVQDAFLAGCETILNYRCTCCASAYMTNKKEKF